MCILILIFYTWIHSSRVIKSLHWLKIYYTTHVQNKPTLFVHFTVICFDIQKTRILSLSKRLLLYNVRFWKMVIVTWDVQWRRFQWDWYRYTSIECVFGKRGFSMIRQILWYGNTFMGHTVYALLNKNLMVQRSTHLVFTCDFL